MDNGSPLLTRLRGYCPGRRGKLSRLRSDQRGATAVEFAIIAPAFFFLIFVIAETALLFIAEQVMDNAVFEAARLVRTGQAQKGTWPNPDEEAAPAPMTKAQFRAEVCGRMAVFVNCSGSNFYLDVKAYDDFSTLDVNQPVNEDDSFKAEGAYDFGGPDEVVIVRAYYQWPTRKIYGGLQLDGMSNGKRMIGSFAAFRNEPYDPS